MPKHLGDHECQLIGSGSDLLAQMTTSSFKSLDTQIVATAAEVEDIPSFPPKSARSSILHSILMHQTEIADQFIGICRFNNTYLSKIACSTEKGDGEARRTSRCRMMQMAGPCWWRQFHRWSQICLKSPQWRGRQHGGFSSSS